MPVWDGTVRKSQPYSFYIQVKALPLSYSEVKLSQPRPVCKHTVKRREEEPRI